MGDATRDRRLLAGALAALLGVVSVLGVAGGFVTTWRGMARTYSESESAALTGACIALAALVPSLAGLVAGVLALRRPAVAPAGTTAAVAGLLVSSLAAFLVVCAVAFAFLSLVVNFAAVM